ncbi:MAG TPA: CmcI family methyltransferase [Kofleriaceae bacterium]
MITVDKDIVTVVAEDGTRTEHPIGTPEAFAILSKLWLRSGWDTKYVYSFAWLGRPIIQLPEDMIRIQELIYTLKPDVIVETGIAHGGSLVFYASLCKLIGKGRVVGIDIEIRPHNRAAIEAHELFPLITLIEGSSVDPAIVGKAAATIKPGETVLVLLDSNHTKEHVLGELNAYASLVTPGSYIVAMDGIMQDVAGAPRTKPEWTWDNPQTAVREFIAANPQFVVEEPPFPFNEGSITERVTYWPLAFVKRIR